MKNKEIEELLKIILIVIFGVFGGITFFFLLARYIMWLYEVLGI